MVSYTITHKCGHVEVHCSPGRFSETRKQSLIVLLGRQLCSDCYRNYRAPGWRRKVAAGMAMAAESGLPALRGSPKQLIWAHQIRGRLAPHFVAMRDRFKHADVEQDPAVGTLLKVISFSLDQIHAGWWIDKVGVVMMQPLRHFCVMPAST